MVMNIAKGLLNLIIQNLVIFITSFIHYFRYLVSYWDMEV